jgi:hypothetical protein
MLRPEKCASLETPRLDYWIWPNARDIGLPRGHRQRGIDQMPGERSASMSPSPAIASSDASCHSFLRVVARKRIEHHHTRYAAQRKDPGVGTTAEDPASQDCECLNALEQRPQKRAQPTPTCASYVSSGLAQGRQRRHDPVSRRAFAVDHWIGKSVPNCRTAGEVCLATLS